MQIPIRISRAAKRALHDQIANEIQELIKGGQLRPQARLPSSRELSNQLSVSRNTITSAYNDLIEQGYLVTRPSGGTFVAPVLPQDTLKVPSERRTGYKHTAQKHVNHLHANATGLYEFTARCYRYNFLLQQIDHTLFPIKTWRRLIANQLSRLRQSVSRYGDPAGIEELRQAISELVVPTRGIAVDPEQVIITAGCQQGLSIITHLLIKEGARVITEEPAYSGAISLFESYGARIIPARVDSEGIDVAAFSTEDAQFVYITPTHQSPLGVTLSYQRRISLLNWSAQCGAYVLEVDYDGDFWYAGSPLPALYALDASDNVIYIGSFSKLLGPGMRLGYILVPKHLIDAVKSVKPLMDNGNSWLDQVVMTEFISTGSYAAHLRRVRRIYLRRRNCMIDILEKQFGDVRLSGLDGGTHLTWAVQPEMRPAQNLVNVFAKNQVAISALNQYQTISCNKEDRLSQLVFLGYAAASEENIEAGVIRMAASL